MTFFSFLVLKIYLGIFYHIKKNIHIRKKINFYYLIEIEEFQGTVLNFLYEKYF